LYVDSSKGQFHWPFLLPLLLRAIKHNMLMHLTQGRHPRICLSGRGMDATYYKMLNAYSSGSSFKVSSSVSA